VFSGLLRLRQRMLATHCSPVKQAATQSMGGRQIFFLPCKRRNSNEELKLGLGLSLGEQID
jgi:hypothetical protein